MCILHIFQGISHKALDTVTAIHSGHQHRTPQSLELLLIEDLFTLVKTQNNSGLLPLFDQSLAKQIHRRYTHTTAQQNRLLAGNIQIIAVAQTGEDIQSSLLHLAHGFGALADYLVYDSQHINLYIANGYWAAKKHAVQFDVYKLAGSSNGRGVSLQPHAVYIGHQSGIFNYFKKSLFHGVFLRRRW